MFSHFSRTPTCDGRTDGQTDRHRQTDTGPWHIPREQSSRGKKGLDVVMPYKQSVILFISFKAGYTANLCAVGLSKAFDKINQLALFLKLMKRQVPNKLLDILENWLCDSYACVKWGNLWWNIFTIKFRVRQGSVLSQFSLQST